MVLNCRDVDTTADWYVRVLGMAREVFGDGRIALVFGNQKINVRPTGAPNWETGAVDAPGSLDLCFIADVEPRRRSARICARAASRSPQARSPKTGALGPMTSHYCRDPDGNLIEVASYSARRLAFNHDRARPIQHRRVRADGSARPQPPQPMPVWPVWSSRPATTCATSSARGRRPSNG